MSDRRRGIWTAVILGLAASALLFYLPDWAPYAARFDFLVDIQFVGIWVCMALEGVHTAGDLGYILIAIPINAAIYAAVILGALRLYRRVVFR